MGAYLGSRAHKKPNKIQEGDFWQAAIHKLKLADDFDVVQNDMRLFQKLKVAYDDLSQLQQAVFLDVAYFCSSGDGIGSLDAFIHASSA